MKNSTIEEGGDNHSQQHHDDMQDGGEPFDDQEAISQVSKGDFVYKEVSEISDVTEESYPEGLQMLKEGAKDLENIDKLMEQTKKKLKIVDDDGTSIASSKAENSDEFLRNFFIKFGMKKTLDSFQQEWFELRAKSQLDTSKLPQIPEIYRVNGQLSDELAVMQQELDEARILAEKARSTYDKLRKQRDFQKINHRRVQQEKQKLNNDISKYKKSYEQNQETFKTLSANYETAVKEKMLMKLEKDRLLAKLENLETNLRQIEEQQAEENKDRDDQLSKAVSKKSKTALTQIADPKGQTSKSKMAPQPAQIPAKDRPNPLLNESFEPVNSRMNLVKTFKGHLMGVTSLAYNPKKAIVATASDDTTWKMWTVPNGDLIMSGEGHLDWIGGLAFNPKGDLLATCSGDGTVKVWDFVNASCAHTFAEHGQPVWKVDFHDTGDFLLSSSMDHTVKLWDLNIGKSRFTYRGHVDSVNSVKFQPFSCLFVSGSGDKTVSLWDIRTNLCVQTFYGHNNSVNSVAFNIRGDSIVSTDSDGMVRVWDVRMVKEIMNFDTGLASANNAIFDKSCTYVFAASEDSSVKVYNLQSKEKESELKGHEDAVLDLCFDNGKEGFLITASSDCSFRLWQ